MVLVRPDLVWYRSVGPHCVHDLSRTTIHRGKPGTSDMLQPCALGAATLRIAGCNP